LGFSIELERADVARYLQHAELAAQLGLAELKVKLEEMAADEAGHGRALRRLLKGP
jgi:bacterioferritin